jgi:hypothetical protein
MIFASDRGGHEDLYLLEANDPEHPKFLEAHQFKVTQLTTTPEAEVGVSFAPDGKRVAFLRAGKLWTMNPDGTDQKVVVSEPQVFDYDWSPDSKWLVFARQDGSFASDLHIVPATGETKDNPIRNVTRHRTYNGDVTWSAKGNKLAYVSERRQIPWVYVTSLQRPAAPNAPASSDIDWDDIHLRAEQAAPMPAVRRDLARRHQGGPALPRPQRRRPVGFERGRRTGAASRPAIRNRSRSCGRSGIPTCCTSAIRPAR